MAKKAKKAKRKATKNIGGKRLKELEAAVASLNRRVKLIEEFLGADLTAFHEKQPATDGDEQPPAQGAG